MNLSSTPTLPAHPWVIGIEKVSRACWRHKSGLIGSAMCARFLGGFVELVKAGVVVAPMTMPFWLQKCGTYIILLGGRHQP